MKRNYAIIILLTTSVFAMVTACNNNSESSAENKLINDSLVRDTSIPVDTNTVKNDNAALPQEADAKLVYEVLENMYGDIALLQQGQNKSTTESLKILAKKLEVSQLQVAEELKALSIKKGWPLPAGASATAMQNISSMGEADIPTYEKDLLVALRKSYETGIKKLEKAGVTDAGVKTAGDQVVNALKVCLNMTKAGG